MALGALTWPEVAGRAEAPLVLVPVGSCEQHGPHLPLDTDTRIAVAVAAAAAAQLGAVVAPAVAIGASGEHAGFAGTLSIGQDALTTVVVELGRSADAFAGLVLVNGHGGNGAALDRAVERLVHEGRRVLLWHAHVPGGDAHAGRTETSLLLAIAPGVVRLDRAAAGATGAIETLLPALRAGGLAAVSPNGVLGDPAGASLAEGGALLAGLVERLVGAVTAWRG